MPLPWMSRTTNEQALEECTALLSDAGTPGLRGRLIFVMGAPRAGASALAQQLYRVARRRRVETLMLGEAPPGGRPYIRTHILRSLQLPLVVSEFQVKDLISRPYEAVFTMRGFHAIIIDDGHDYFTGQSYVVARNMETLVELTLPPANRQVFVFGYRSVLACRAVALAKREMEVIRINLGNMENGDDYRQLVDTTLNAYATRFSREPTAIDAQALYRATNGSVGLTIDLVRNIVRYPPVADMLSILVRNPSVLSETH